MRGKINPAIKAAMASSRITRVMCGRFFMLDVSTLQAALQREPAALK